MEEKLTNLWGKRSKDDEAQWHPLILHLLDVAASADAILMREPESTRTRMAAILDMKWEEARPWILLLTACHDLGKACPGFQCKWPAHPDLTGLQIPRSPNTNINHAFVSQLALTQLLQARGWSNDLAELVSDAVGCHHGNRASPIILSNLEGDRRATGDSSWTQVRQSIFEALLETLQPTQVPTKQTLDGPDFMLLAGLTSFADWIGSNEDWFCFGTPAECGDLQIWFQKRRARADEALDAIGWNHRIPLSTKQRTFEQVFNIPPRPLQQAVVDALETLEKPSILLVEAPMGEGKTEAAFFAHLELQRRFKHRGMYVALPTKATGNAIFIRTLDFLRSQRVNQTLDLQLLHGGKLLNDTFQNLRISNIHDFGEEGDVRAAEWFTNKKRALLSEYGVGTVDQALLPILPVRHNFVRLWGLANRVVVLDEIHAYDAYTGTLLVHLLRWLLALGSSVILLSATLTPDTRRKLAGAFSIDFPEKEDEYPRLSVFTPGEDLIQKHFRADPTRRLNIQVKGISPEPQEICAEISKYLPNSGMALVLVNTVQRAQELYSLFPHGEPLELEDQRVGKCLTDGTKIFLFHARFPGERRQKREEQVLATFGETAHRTGRKILIATQVAEQSLDLDFDLIITDLAPIDLVLQRAGRLWRHARTSRPVTSPTLLIAGLAGDEPPSFAKPLWWGSVYREDILLYTWSLLRTKSNLTLPDDIDTLVQAVYEEQFEVPEFLRERLEKSRMISDGKSISHRIQANQAIIGLPDDASWNEPAKFVLYDEDAPDVHRTLMAQTRLGEESCVGVPLWPEDEFQPHVVPDFSLAKQWFLRSMNLSRAGVVKKLQQQGVPEGWKKSALLRNCFPLRLDEWNHWLVDSTVRLDCDLGLVYGTKEGE